MGMTPQPSIESDPAGKNGQEEQGATDKFKKDESGTKPTTVVPSDPVPDRPGDPKPAEIAGKETAGTGRDVSTSGVEREQEPDSQSRF
jgi:hypothetical protein